MRKWWHFAAVAAGALACRASVAKADMQWALRNTAHGNLLQQIVTAGDWCMLRSELADAYFVDVAVAGLEQESDKADKRESDDYYIDELGFCNDPSCPCHDSVIGTERTDQDYAADNLGTGQLEAQDEKNLDDQFNADYYSDFNDEYFQEFAADSDPRHTGNDIAEQLNQQDNLDEFGWEPAEDEQIDEPVAGYEDELEEDWIHRNLINDPYPTDSDTAEQIDEPETVRAEDETSAEPTWFDYGSLVDEEAATQTDEASDSQDEADWLETGEPIDQNGLEADLREAYGEEPYIEDGATDSISDGSALDADRVDDYLEYEFGSDDQFDQQPVDTWDSQYDDGTYEDESADFADMADEEFGRPEPYAYDDYGVDLNQGETAEDPADAFDASSEYRSDYEGDWYEDYHSTWDGQDLQEDEAAHYSAEDPYAEEDSDWAESYEYGYDAAESAFDTEDRGGIDAEQSGLDYEDRWYEEYDGNWYEGQLDQEPSEPASEATDDEMTDPYRIDDSAWQNSEESDVEDWQLDQYDDDRAFSADVTDELDESSDLGSDQTAGEEDWYLYDYEYGIDQGQDEAQAENVEAAAVDIVSSLGRGIRLSTLLMQAARAVERIETAVQAMPLERYLGNVTADEDAAEIESLLDGDDELACPYCTLRAWESEAENAEE